MKYRVEVDVSFDDKQVALDLLNYVEKIKEKAVEYTTGKSDLNIVKVCRYHECLHDEGKPCGNYTNVDFASKDIIEHK